MTSEDKINEVTRLANLFGSDKGDQHFEKHHYTRVYSEYFEPIRHERLRVLEIGLLHVRDRGWDDPTKRNTGEAVGSRAPSMEMWAGYFTNAEIFGFDINEFRGIEIDRCKIVRGDMGNRADLERLIAETGGHFDIIIDDASHASHHQQIALGFLFPHLNGGGTYWIEDLHYQPPALERRGVTKTLKVLSHLERTREFRSDLVADEQSTYVSDNVASIEFYDSMRVEARRGRDALAVLTKKGAKRPQAK